MTQFEFSKSSYDETTVGQVINSGQTKLDKELLESTLLGDPDQSGDEGSGGFWGAIPPIIKVVGPTVKKALKRISVWFVGNYAYDKAANTLDSTLTSVSGTTTNSMAGITEQKIVDAYCDYLVNDQIMDGAVEATDQQLTDMLNEAANVIGLPLDRLLKLANFMLHIIYGRYYGLNYIGCNYKTINPLLRSVLANAKLNRQFTRLDGAIDYVLTQAKDGSLSIKATNPKNAMVSNLEKAVSTKNLLKDASGDQGVVVSQVLDIIRANSSVTVKTDPYFRLFLHETSRLDNTRVGLNATDVDYYTVLWDQVVNPQKYTTVDKLVPGIAKLYVQRFSVWTADKTDAELQELFNTHREANKALFKLLRDRAKPLVVATSTNAVNGSRTNTVLQHLTALSKVSADKETFADIKTIAGLDALKFLCGVRLV